MAEVEEIPGLDGDRRQKLASDLWRSWREEGGGAAIITGFSGVGKTQGVVRPLVARATDTGNPAVIIEVPLHATNLDRELTGLLVEQLRFSDRGALAEAITVQPSFGTALRHLLRHDALVVIDEFQRLLDRSRAQPVEPFAATLRMIAQRPPDAGCFWLVTNRALDPGWTEPFYTALLEPPTELEDLQRIVLLNIAKADAEDRFPTDRRLEIVRRLGANPRVLRLLGQLLRQYHLQELLGPPADIPEASLDSPLVVSIEHELLRKAKEGLSNAANVILRDLSVLYGPVPWELLHAMGTHLGDVSAISRELRERYLLEIGANNSYQVHPAAREVGAPILRRDGEAWREAHRRAGMWYARYLRAAAQNQMDDSTLALRLAGARYHLVEAEAFDDLREAMCGIQAYIERQYSWMTRRATSALEREARISLLNVYLKEPGPASVEYQFAKALNERSATGDLLKALPHAQRATVGQNFHTPWVLWIQLVREVEGLDAAVKAARMAVREVAPDKGLYSIYQFLGACLNHLGRTEEAIDSLLEGWEHADGLEERLVEQAVFIAAAETSTQRLQRIRDRAKALEGCECQLVLADVLLCEHEADWRHAAATAQSGRDRHPRYLHFARHEALCWIALGDPQNAQNALDRFPGTWWLTSWSANAWVAALVAVDRGDLARGSRFLATFLDESAPTDEAAIRGILLREWDHRVATVGEWNPALAFPILPAAATGLQHNIRRPQYGPPVLPQHQSGPSKPSFPNKNALRVLAIGTEWHSGHGGLSTFNRQLCIALSRAGIDVVCVVLHASLEEQRHAAEVQKVRLVEATRTPGSPEHGALSRKPRLPDGFVPDLIIGHGRVTGPAAQVQADDHFQTAKRLHFVHMAPDEIEWFKDDREDDAGSRAEARTQTELDLGRTAARLIAVGPRLYNRYLRDLHPYNVPPPIRLDPGFDAAGTLTGTPPPGEPWIVFLMGRLEDATLKGVDLAATAVSQASRRRVYGTARLELVVRGAPPDTSQQLREKLLEWAGFPAPGVVVRPYTTAGESIDADIRRASLLLMPSRTEGFGLVGLEAIVAGTPALVSSESGLGEMLREILDADQARRIVVPMSGDEQDAEQWARDIEGILRDREAAFQRATELRTLLAEKKTWAAAVTKLLNDLGEMPMKNE